MSDQKMAQYYIAKPGKATALISKIVPPPSLPPPFSTASISILNQKVDSYMRSEVATQIKQKKVSKARAKLHGQGDNYGTNLPVIARSLMDPRTLGQFSNGELLFVLKNHDNAKGKDVDRYFVKGLNALNRHLKVQFDEKKYQTAEGVFEYWAFIGTVDTISVAMSAHKKTGRLVRKVWLNHIMGGETKRVFNVWINSFNGTITSGKWDVWLLLRRYYFPKEKDLSAMIDEPPKRALTEREIFSANEKEVGPPLKDPESDSKDTKTPEKRNFYWQFVPYFCTMGSKPALDDYCDRKERWWGLTCRIGTMHWMNGDATNLTTDATQLYLSDKPVCKELLDILPTAQLLLGSRWMMPF